MKSNGTYLTEYFFFRVTINTKKHTMFIHSWTIFNLVLFSVQMSYVYVDFEKQPLRNHKRVLWYSDFQNKGAVIM